MIDVYYPYIEGKSIWHELRYSLRSLEMHLKTPFRVVIIGDCPNWVKNVYHIPVEPITLGAECCLRDTLNKLNVYMQHENTACDFLRMYDDVYLINDVKLWHFSKVRSMYSFSNMPQNEGVWWQQLRRTAKELLNVGFNTETHFPELFDKVKMQKVFDFFDPVNKRLLVSSLYYNTHFDSCDFIPQNKVTGDGAKFYGQRAVNNFNFGPQDNIEKACTNKLFLNHNDDGLTDELKNWLMQKFPNKSIYES